ncbi:phosphate acyltransferase, partial [bacterium]|nr:phosphate acyltransferase [bacterium]
GVAAAGELAYDLSQSGFGDLLAARIASAASSAEASAAQAGAEQEKDGTDP